MYERNYHKGPSKNPTCRLGDGPKDACLEARESGALSRHSRDDSLGRDGLAKPRECHKKHAARPRRWLQSLSGCAGLK